MLSCVKILKKILLRGRRGSKFGQNLIMWTIILVKGKFMKFFTYSLFIESISSQERNQSIWYFDRRWKTMFFDYNGTQYNVNGRRKWRWWWEILFNKVTKMAIKKYIKNKLTMLIIFSLIRKSKVKGAKVTAN